MTGVEVPPNDRLREIIQQRRSAALSGGFISPEVSPSERAEPWYDKAFYYINKPLEWSAKGLGKALDLGPKYDFATPSHGLYDQPDFSMILRDVGMEPVSAAILGGAAAMALPWDPVNKLKIAGMTKKGFVSEQIPGLTERGLLKVDTAGRAWISHRDLTKRIGRLNSIIQSQRGTARAVRQAEKELPKAERALAQRKELNTVLQQLQDKGVTYKELANAPAKAFEQARLGQRRLLGFTSPFALDQFSVLSRTPGFTKLREKFWPTVGTFDDASMRLPGIAGKIGDKVHGAIWEGLDATIGAAGRKIADKTRDFLAAWGYPTMKSAKQKELHAKFSAIMAKYNNLEGPEAISRLLSVLREAKKMGVPLEEMKDVGRALEDRTGLQSITEAESKFVTKIIEDNYEKLDVVPEEITLQNIDEHLNTVRASRLDPNGRLIISPADLTDRDVVTARALYMANQAPKIAVDGYKSHIGDNYLVLQGRSEKTFDKFDLKETSGIVGVPNYIRDKDLLIARARPESARMISPRQPHKGGIAFEPAHAQNLELIAAQLATRGKAIAELQPSDLLLTPGGMVDLVNLDKIVPAKGLQAARESSATTLERFFTEYGSFAEPSHNFLYLGTDEATKLVSKRAARELRLKKAAYPAVEGDSGFMNAYDLMDQAVNTAIHRQYAIRFHDGLKPLHTASLFGDPSEFSRANGIDSIREKLREQVAQGRRPTIDPIEIARDDVGNMYIKDGRDRLTAAIMEGIQAVPVKRTNFIGESVDFTGVAVGPSFRVDHLFYSGYDQAVSELPENAQKFLNTDYKLSTLKGSRVILKGNEISPPDILMMTVGKWLGLTKRGFLNERIPTFIAAVMAKAEDQLSAGISIATMAEKADNYFNFAKALQTKYGITVSNVLDPRLKAASELTFGKDIKAAAKQYLDTLASEGVFTNTTIADASRLGLYNGVVEIFDPGRNALKVVSNQKTADSLLQYAKNVMDQRVGAEDIIPYSKIIAAGADEVKEARMLDLVTSPHPRIVESLTFNRKFTISKDYIKELEKKGIYYDPKTIPGIDPVLKKLVIRQPGEAPKYNRPTYSFFMTSTGHIFVGTHSSHSNPTRFLRDIFGEGFVPPGEWGVINDEGVHLFNLLGTNAKVLGKAEIRSMEGRLRLISSKILEGGAGPGTPITVRVPWQVDRWEDIFGKKRTLGELANKDWKLKVPKELVGTPLDLVVDAPHFAVNVVRNRVTGKARQALTTFIMDEQDELAKLEKMAGIDTRLITNYFHRVLSPGGKLAMDILKRSPEALAKLNSVFANLVGKTIKAKNIEPFMLERFFHDYRTDEINAIIQAIREGKAGGLKSEDIFGSMLGRIKDEKDFVAFDNIASALSQADTPIDTAFFHEDAVISHMMRVRESVRARATQEMVDLLSSSDLVVSVTKAERAEISKILTNQNPSYKRIEELNAEELGLATRKKMMEDKASADLHGDMKKIDDRIKEIQEERGKLRMDIDDISMAAIKKYGAMVRHVGIDEDIAYIDQKVAQRLLNSGALKQEDLLSFSDNPIVRVPVTKVAASLGNDERILFFTKEAQPLLERYFGASRRMGGKSQQLLDWYDGALSLWKQYTLFPVPSYHVRNFWSNGFMAWLGGVTDLESFGTGVKLWFTMRKVNKGVISPEEAIRLLEDSKVYNQAGVPTSLRDLWGEFVSRGGSSSGLHYNEFSRFENPETMAELVRKAEDAGYEPSAKMAGSFLLDNKLLRGTKSLAAGMDDIFRLATFYDYWKKTGSFEKAAMQMKAVFYDYKDLNLFERSFLRRVFPFYAWSRHNIPRMLTALYTEPGRLYKFNRFTRDIQEGALEGEALDPETLPDYVRNSYGLILGKREDGTYVVKALDAFYPIYDVFKLFDSPSRFIRDGLTPFAKWPIEELKNESLFSGAELEKFPGEPARSWSLGKLGFKRRALSSGGNFFKDIIGVVTNEHTFQTFFRAPRDVYQFIDGIFDQRTYKDEKPGLGGATLDLVFGRMYYVDPVRTRQLNQQKFSKILSGFDDWIQYAEKHGDKDTANVIRKMKLRHLLEKTPGAN